MIYLEDEEEEDFVKAGRMRKAPLDMTPAELKSWREEMAIGIREYLFSIGQPLVYEKDGVLIAEFADGHIEKV